ncbi:MAG: A/G-specific adenine glycosylase [Thermaerobacter sp.]|nr:A/G-specific adenine glycosylase [Thermaerobacter sp.]
MSQIPGNGGAVQSVLRWYDEEGRDLPWRQDPRTPYRVLIAEAMLQQTRAETVAPRYEVFLQRFPDLQALAAAPQDEVLRSWEGLGYYARARNLQRLAQMLTAQGGGLPADRAALIGLPGVGEYIASALRSFAFGIPDPPLDANLRRIALRYAGIPGDPLDAASGAAARKLLADWFQMASPAQLGDALMDLGARVCTARRPDCAVCPLQEGCAAVASGAPEEFGVRRPKAAPRTRRILAAQIVSPQGQAWRPRPAKGMLGGLWEPPHVLSEEDAPSLDDLRAQLAQWGVESAEPAGERWPLKHVFTHQVWEGEVIRFVVQAGPLVPPARWLDARSIAQIAVPRAFRTVLAGGK